MDILKTTCVIVEEVKTIIAAFLADRTIGRAYGTVCRLSSVCDVLPQYTLWTDRQTD